MGSDLIVVEIGQNSNTTYRICDYGRGREMHLDDALNVINIDLPARRSPGLTSDFGGYARTIYFLHDAFAWELLDVRVALEDVTDPGCFDVLTCVEGTEYSIITKGKHISVVERASCPACMGAHHVQGRIKLLRSFIPDKNRAKEKLFEAVGA